MPAGDSVGVIVIRQFRGPVHVIVDIVPSRVGTPRITAVLVIVGMPV